MLQKTMDIPPWGNEVLPPEGHDHVGHVVFHLLGKILEDKEAKGLPKKWTRNYELSKNRHWKKSAGTKVPLVSANLLFTHRQRTVNLLTDNNPTFNIRKVGKGGEDETVYESMLHAAEWWWGDTEQQHVLEMSVTNGETYGCTVEKVIFNDQAEHGLGEVETILVDPFNFGVYPVDVHDIQKAEAVLHFYAITVREARRLWPDYADQIMADSDVLRSLGDERTEIATGRSTEGWLSTFRNMVRSVLTDAGTSDSLEDKCLIVECWVKDYTMKTVDEEEPIIDERNQQPVLDPETNEPLMRTTGRRMTQPVYDGYIRCATVCNGGELVLQDVPNPSINWELGVEVIEQTFLFDKFPFSRTQSITDTTDPWGMSDIEQLDALQMEVNKSISQFTMLKDKAARLKLINPQNSGVKNEEFDNVPGIINPTNEMVAQAIKYMDPPQVPVDIVNGLQMYRELFFMIAGSFELEQASEPGKEVVAYKAIAALIERASTMLKGKIRNYGKMIRDRGRMYISCMQNWYTEERWITFFEDGQEMTESIQGTELMAPSKLIVVSGSTMPISRIQEREEALALFQMGAIDLEELLKKVDWPDRKNVIKRVQQGPLGAFIEKLAKLGLPEPFIQYFQQIASMDPKEFEKLLKKGELPTIPELVKAFQQSGGKFGQGSSPMEQAEVEAKMAEIRKLNAETALTTEKINTEKTQQEVSRAGVAFDQESLKLEKAKTVAEIQAQIDQIQLDIQDMMLGNATKVKTERMKARSSRETAIRSAQDKKVQGPYRDKGLKSNNKQPRNKGE